MLLLGSAIHSCKRHLMHVRCKETSQYVFKFEREIGFIWDKWPLKYCLPLYPISQNKSQLLSFVCHFYYPQWLFFLAKLTRQQDTEKMFLYRHDSGHKMLLHLVVVAGSCRKWHKLVLTIGDYGFFLKLRNPCYNSISVLKNPVMANKVHKAMFNYAHICWMLLDADAYTCSIFWPIACLSTPRQENLKHIHDILINTPADYLVATSNHNNFIFSQEGIICTCNMSASDMLAQPVPASVPAHPCDWPFPTKGYLGTNPPLKCHTAVQNCTRKKVKKTEVIISIATYSSAHPLSQENTAGDCTKKSWINEEFLGRYCKLQEEKGKKKD